jgi:hypothetical protein
MRHPSCSLRAATLALLLAASGATAQAQSTANDSKVDPAVARQQSTEISKGDPKRWYNEPTDVKGRLRILLKEIDAAYKQARNECRQRPASERSACLKEAKAIWQHDKAQAPELVKHTPGGIVVEPVPVPQQQQQQQQ